MIKVIQQDITEVKTGIIAHQVNCQGVMGSGVAAALKAKWPSIFTEYKFFCSRHLTPTDLLGKVHLVEVEPNLYVANVFGQLNYGSDKKLYTNYKAVDKAMETLAEIVKPMNTQLYVPSFMGCGLGGGNWNVYQEIIEKHFPNAIGCVK